MNTVHGAADDSQSALLEAIKQRDVAAVRAAIEKGADVNAKGPFDRTPLHAAVTQSTEAVQLLIAHGAKLDEVDGDGRTPLHLADADSAAVLLAAKASFLILDKNGNSVLHTAAESDARMCRLLVEAGLPVDVRNNAGLAPLHFAALQAKQGVAEYLLSVGADVNARTLGNYSYKWSYVAWDVLGMEEAVPAHSTPLSIARRKHRQSKWNTSAYEAFAKFLVSRGAVESSGGAGLRAVWLLSPVAFVGFFAALFQIDARLRGWNQLAQQYATTVVPTTLENHQDGSVGRIGTIQLKKMLRAAATEQGLYLAMPRWVIGSHPPLLIPWSQLQIESCDTSFTGAPLMRLSMASHPSSVITLRDGVAGAVSNRLTAVSGRGCP